MCPFVGPRIVTILICAVIVQGCPVLGVHIAFSAYRDTSVTLGLDQVVKFDKVLTNDGEAYCSDTGIFTATLPGAYFFTWSLATHASTNLVAGIAVNGQYKAHLANHLASGNSFNMASNSVILKLAIGDTVWIGVNHGSSVFSNKGDGWFYPTFSGHLLYV